MYLVCFGHQAKLYLLGSEASNRFMRHKFIVYDTITIKLI